MVSVNDDSLTALLMKDESIEIDITYHRLQPYNIMELVRYHRNSFDDIDLLEERLKFEVGAEQHGKTKN